MLYIPKIAKNITCIGQSFTYLNVFLKIEMFLAKGEK